MLVGGQNRYRGKFKQWRAEFSMVCWWVGKNRQSFPFWCAGALMVCRLVGKKVDSMNISEWCAGALMVCLVAGRRVGELLCRWCAGVLLNRNGRSVL